MLEAGFVSTKQFRFFNQYHLALQSALLLPCQVVSLLGLVDSLLQGEEVGGGECGEAELVAWAGALLNTHYLQLVVSKEEQTREAVARLQVNWTQQLGNVYTFGPLGPKFVKYVAFL